MVADHRGGRVEWLPLLEEATHTHTHTLSLSHTHTHTHTHPLLGVAGHRGGHVKGFAICGAGGELMDGSCSAGGRLFLLAVAECDAGAHIGVSSS